MEPVDRDLPLEPTLLEAFGLRRMWATAEPDPDALAPLFQALCQEDCGHTWRGKLLELRPSAPRDLLDALLSDALAFRPTTLFTYMGQSADGVEPVAFATVSERVRGDFPHDGFPVLARAYVHPRWRGRGLYPHLVQHRLDHCVRRWGADLCAIHLGAADPVVRRTVARGDGLSLRFVEVGDELLAVGRQTLEVPDYVAFLPAFVDRLPHTPPDLLRFVDGGVGSMPWSQLRPGLIGHANAAVTQLVDLLDAIGVRH